MVLDFSMPILVVDDMPAMRTIVRNMLETIGFQAVFEAEDAEIAWRMIQRESYGLVIADWNMPGMSGIDLLRVVRNSRQRRNLPFMIITGQSNQRHLTDALNAGVTEFIVKPFDEIQLQSKIIRINSLNA